MKFTYELTKTGKGRATILTTFYPSDEERAQGLQVLALLRHILEDRESDSRLSRRVDAEGTTFHAYEADITRAMAIEPALKELSVIVDNKLWDALADRLQESRALFRAMDRFNLYAGNSAALGLTVEDLTMVHTLMQPVLLNWHGSGQLMFELRYLMPWEENPAGDTVGTVESQAYGYDAVTIIMDTVSSRSIVVYRTAPATSPAVDPGPHVG